MFGAVIGDVVGSRFEFNNIKTKEFEFLDDCCYMTDDSVCTVAIAKALLESNKDKTKLYGLSVKYLRQYFNEYPDVGFGGNFFIWACSTDPKPYFSWGNGSAMRVSACGWLANSLKEAEELAEIVSSPTHNHEEGIKGAKATAAAIYLARTGKSKEEIIDYVTDIYYPQAYYYKLDEMRPNYKWDVSCQGTVPVALTCFRESKSFEDAIRNAVSMGGDSDTMAAITGSIAEAYYGIPKKYLKKIKEFIPEEFINILNAIPTDR